MEKRKCAKCGYYDEGYCEYWGEEVKDVVNCDVEQDEE
jgi:hypothetical protein